MKEHFDEQALQEAFNEYEEAEKEIQQIYADHPEVFEKLDELKDKQEAARERAKKIVYVKKQPPPWLKTGKRIHAAASGGLLQLDVTYKARKPHYDAKRLPRAILEQPGVVVEVDTRAVDQILKDSKFKKERQAILAARVEEQWMSPQVSIGRLKRDD